MFLYCGIRISNINNYNIIHKNIPKLIVFLLFKLRFKFGLKYNTTSYYNYIIERFCERNLDFLFLLKFF